MQPAAVPCTSNGMKRTAASALDSGASSTNTSQSNKYDQHTGHMDQKSQSISPPPPEKRSFIVIESPLKLDTIDSAEDLDLKVLRIQNKNLSERLLQRRRLEEDLKEKLDFLQNRKLADDSKLCIMDRYWTQLDEDLRLILERFDNTASESSKLKELNDKKPSSPAVRNFLAKLNDWDKVELEDNLKDRVKFTTQAVSKLISNYDRITKRIDQYHKELGSQDKVDAAKTQEIIDENIRVNELITKCQQKTHQLGLERKQLEDQIIQQDVEIKQLNSKNESLEYDLDKFRDKAFKLDRQLADTIVKLNNAQKQVQATQGSTGNSNSQLDKNGHLVLHSGSNSINQSVNNKGDSKTSTLTDKQIAEIESDLEENKELASARLQELEKMNVQYQNALKQIEKLKADLNQAPESSVCETAEYRQLQTKYSLVVSDNIKLKSALDESKNLIDASRVTFQRQLETMESDELNQQKRLGNEMMQLEEQLTQIRKENELLRIEYEQNVAANEQTGPINKEMRSLITTLQTNNKLLKSDNVRTKKRLEEALHEAEKLKKQIAHLAAGAIKAETLNKTVVKTEPQMLEAGSEVKREDVKNELSLSKDSQIKDLKEQNQKLADDKKDLKNLLEIYSKSNKQSPNISSGPQASLKHKIGELEEAKLEIKRLKESLDRYKSPTLNKIIIPTQQIPTQMLLDNPTTGQSHHHNEKDENAYLSAATDYTKKIKSLEETIRELHKNLSSKKQEETALLNDMEITGQAFEDMQEQNVRLMQQLREKDDANFKLVSERIKLENVQKILKEEKEINVQQVMTLQEQLETQMLISKKLEEQLLLANQTIMLTEKDICHWQHSCENYRRQAIDHMQLIQDLKLNTQKYLSQLKEVQQQVADKSEALASQSFMNKRTQEEIKHLHIKIERQKKFEMASNMDEVLKEEIKEYKEQLRCPSCKVKQKDAVLTKCFHVFCFDCLQKRYDTRQRKCPKCNAGFGANDFRKLYLS